MSDLSLPERAGRGAGRHLVLLAVVPALVVAALGGAAAALLLTVHHSAQTRWTVGGVAAGATLVVLIDAARRAHLASRAINRRVTVADASTLRWVAAMRSVVEDGRKDVQRLVDQVRRGEHPEQPDPLPPAASADNPFADLEYGLRLLLHDTYSAIVQAAARQQVDVFVTIARRLQSLVNRSLEDLDALEREVEDPDLLDGLFKVDHLSTLLRRHVESLAVLGGAVPRRVSRPVAVYTVLRQAISEVEHYARVKVLQPIDGTVHGHAATDLIHLVAELVENATKFSPPNTEVQVRAQMVAAGLAIDIDDRGLAIEPVMREQLEAMLSRPDLVDLDEQLRDGRIGLFVVARLAQRHGIAVRLRPNVYGGTQAVVVLPHSLLDPSGAEVTRRQLEEAGVVPTPGGAPTGQEPLPVRVPDATRETPARSAPSGASALPQRRGDEGAPSTDSTAPAADDRPPLPRRSGSYLVPELRDSAAGDRSPAAPSPDLMARFAKGFNRSGGEDDQPGRTDPAS